VKFLFVSVGKTKNKNTASQIEDYLKRIKKYIPSELKELKEVKGVSSKDIQKIMLKEGEALEKYITKDSYSICLDENGKHVSTIEFSNFIKDKLNSGIKQITFILGGPFGFSDDIKKKANLTISLSKLTFPHEMARLILLEQVFRSLTIIRGQNYHY